MNLNFRPLTESDISELTSWRYEAPYDIYHLPHPPTAGETAKWLAPEVAGHGIWNQAGEMIGFCTFGMDGQVPGGDYDTDALDIGMGIRPDHTGRRLGKRFIQSVIDFAQRTVPPPTPPLLRVTIATFNQRAIRAWQRHGLEPRETFQATRDGRGFTIFERAFTQ